MGVRLSKVNQLAVGLAVVVATMSGLNCSKERGVNPKPELSYRLYAVGGGLAPPLYYFEVDDSSHHIIDSISDIGSVYQMDISPDGRFLYVGRNVVGGTEIVLIDVVAKSEIGHFPGSGLFALSGTGDTIVVDCDAGLCLLNASNLSVISVRSQSLPRPKSAKSKPWVASVTTRPDSSVVVYNYATDSIVAGGNCFGLDGIKIAPLHVSIDPEGKRLYVTAFRVLVIDIASWTTIAEFPMLSRFGQVGFGPGGSPVFLPDPGNQDFNFGLIYAISPHDFQVLDTITAVGPPCRAFPRSLSKLCLSPHGSRSYGFKSVAPGRAPILVFDTETFDIVEWIVLPGTCDGGIGDIATGPTPD